MPNFAAEGVHKYLGIRLLGSGRIIEKISENGDISWKILRFFGRDVGKQEILYKHGVLLMGGTDKIG